MSKSLSISAGGLGRERVAPGKRMWRIRPAKPDWRRLAVALVVTLGIFYASLVFVYRYIDPAASNLMLSRVIAGEPVKHRWVSIEDISPNVLRAVIMSEDARFCRHWGVDWTAIETALAKAGPEGPRGASTISMQTAKNLFLWSSRSYVRKAIELPLAYLMDLMWSKPRMLEIYLNIAEWGPGVFGIEAAAQYHFKRSADRLGPYQAALLAVSLPNPAVRRASRPGRWMRGQAARIRKRMQGSGPWTVCVFDG